MHPSENLDWDKALRKLGPLAPKNCSPFWLGDSDELSDKLCTLVLGGKKTATASLLWEWEFEKLSPPVPGEKHILLDWFNAPLGILTNTSVNIVPFINVTADFAELEGEGDLSLEWWRQTHWGYFKNVCININRTSTEDMPVVCQEFVFRQLGDDA